MNIDYRTIFKEPSFKGSLLCYQNFCLKTPHTVYIFTSADYGRYVWPKIPVYATAVIRKGFLLFLSCVFTDVNILVLRILRKYYNHAPAVILQYLFIYLFV